MIESLDVLQENPLDTNNDTHDAINFKLLAENIPVMAWTATPDGRPDYWNKYWYDYTGLTPEYPADKLWKAALHPDDLQRTLNAWSHSVSTGEDFSTEYRFRRAADGQYRWHLGRGVALLNSDNSIAKWYGAITDIHEQKEAEHSKDIFLSAASHELKMPLTTLKTIIHLFKKTATPGNEGYELIDRADSQLQRIERLIGNLLDVSKINAHTMIYKLEAFNFSELVRECAERVQQQSLTHKIILLQNARILFTGDKLRLEQVVNNLLSNAIKYSPDANTVHLKSYVQGNDIILSVQDFGIGIAPEERDKIYTAYYRAGNAQRRFAGLGLGLYICAEIVKSHFGKLWVESVPGEGATFYVRLPINRQLLFLNEEFTPAGALL